jgi:hypothetical protein
MNYFLLDDNTIAISESIISNINTIESKALDKSEKLKIIPIQLVSWEDDLQKIKDIFADADGIILDWRLSEPNDNSKITYSAESLAQHIRFLITDKQLKRDIPIVIFSANSDFKESYRRDGTGHDLFLRVYSKDDFSQNSEGLIEDLLSLGQAFKDVQKNTNLKVEDLLCPPSPINFDSRLKSEISELIEKKIPHNLIKFILDEVVLRPGVLIGEEILAARLGIDISGSPDWTDLVSKTLTPSIGYAGVLSTGWNRWWADGLIAWWKAEINDRHPQYFNAVERVKMLQEKTNYKSLTPAKKLPFCLSDEFWVICENTRNPIDISDGLLIQTEVLRPWQDEQYVSLYSILEGYKSFKLNPLEKERFEHLKKMTQENGKR